MKILKRIRLKYTFLTLLALFSLIPTEIASAAPNNIIRLDPSTASVQPGQSFEVRVRGSLSDNWFNPNAVSGTVTFPQNLLRVTNTSTNGTTFNWQESVSPNNSNGTINFNMRSMSSVDDQNVHIFTITFRALANGSAGVGFTGNTQYSAWSQAVQTTRVGGTYTISTPPPATCPAGQTGTPPNCTTPPPATCPAGQVGTPPNCTTPSKPKDNTPTPNSPQSPSDPAGPIASPELGNSEPDTDGFSIGDVTVTRKYNSALLNWTTPLESKSTVAYGSSLDSLDQTLDASQLPDGTYEASFSKLIPGKQYYYTITSNASADPNKTDTYSGVFTTRGYPVEITITENKQKSANANVKIANQNYKTDKNGRLLFDLASGTYSIEVVTKNGKKAFQLKVVDKPIPEDDSTPEVQKFSFDISATSAGSSNSSLFMIIGGIIAAALALAALAFWLWKRRQQSEDQEYSDPNSASDSDSSWSPPPTPPEFPINQAPLPTAPAMANDGVSALPTQTTTPVQQPAPTPVPMPPQVVAAAPVQQTAPVANYPATAPAPAPISMQQAQPRPTNTNPAIPSPAPSPVPPRQPVAPVQAMPIKPASQPIPHTHSSPPLKSSSPTAPKPIEEVAPRPVAATTAPKPTPTPTPEAKPAPKPEATPEPKPVAKPTEAAPEKAPVKSNVPTPESHPEPAAKSTAKPTEAASTKPATTSLPKPTPTPEAKPAPKPEATPEPKPVAKPTEAAPEKAPVKSDVPTPESHPEPAAKSTAKPTEAASTNKKQNNSVYIDDEEPEDMFDAAKKS